MAMLYLSGVILGVYWVGVEAVIPPPPVSIPSTTPGDVFGNGSDSAQVKLEAFLDLNCPDSYAVWPNLKKLTSHYSPKQLQLIIHLFPLPYHHNAFLCAQGFNAMKDFHGGMYKWAYFDQIMNNWSKFGTQATKDRSLDDVISVLASDAATVSHITPEEFKDGFMKSDDVTRTSWKYGCRRGVAGTPWYFVNGFDLGLGVPVSFPDWTKLIDTLLQAK